MINNKFCANADINNMGEGTRLECKRWALPELNIIIGTTYYLKIRKQHISFILLMDLNSVNHCDPCGLYLLHIPIILVGTYTLSVKIYILRKSFMNLQSYVGSCKSTVPTNFSHELLTINSCQFIHE